MGNCRGAQKENLAKTSACPETALADSFFCTPIPGEVSQELDPGHIPSPASLAKGKVSGQKISGVPWTPPPFFWVTHVPTRVCPKAWWAGMCRRMRLRATLQGCSLAHP